MRYILWLVHRTIPCVTLDTMWTPLLLICYIDRPDCAIPTAPAYRSEAECRESLAYVLEVYRPMEGTAIMAYDCYNWGVGS